MAAPAALIPANPTLRQRVRLARLRARGVTIHGTPFIGAGSHIEGNVTIGAGAVLGEKCRVVAKERSEIGRNALLGDGVVLTDFEPAPDDPDTPTRHQPLRTAPIEVGAGARIGHGACLLPGVRVEPGASVPPNTVLQ